MGSDIPPISVQEKSSSIVGKKKGKAGPGPVKQEGKKKIVKLNIPQPGGWVRSEAKVEKGMPGDFPKPRRACSSTGEVLTKKKDDSVASGRR